MNALSSFRDQQFRVVPVKSVLADGATTYLSNPPTGPRDKNRCPASRRCLTKRERKCPHARIEELDFEDPLLNSTLLPDELIETGLSNLAGAVTDAISSSTAAGSGSVQSHPKPYGLAIFGWTLHQMQVAAVEPEGDLAVRFAKNAALSAHLPRSNQSPTAKAQSRRHSVGPSRIARDSFGGTETFGAATYVSGVRTSLPGGASTPSAERRSGSPLGPAALFSFRSAMIVRSDSS